MQAHIPIVKTLALVFADKAREARAIMEMSRAQLSETPAGAARIRECFNPPKTYDLRLHALNALGETYGLEACETLGGSFAEYLNTGDTYAPTLIYWRGKYRVQSLGDFIETQERNGVHFK